jgi:hypothetical protein
MLRSERLLPYFKIYMWISVYKNLPASAQMELHWPGADMLKEWADWDSFAALQVAMHEESVPSAIEAYSASSPEPSFPYHHIVGRGGTLCLLLQEWTLHLHQDRVNVLVGDEPALKSRIRSHKGLIAPKCKHAAISFDQAEFQLNEQSSVIINRIEVSSTGLESCFQPLGDTFKSFGVFLSPDSSGVPTLTEIFRAFQQKRAFWRWEPERLLPIVCTGSNCLFFLQGVANERTVELILYSPSVDIEKHLEVARNRFGATISTIF